MKKRMLARVVKSKLYKRVVEINCPMRFYWDKNGDFDGVDYDLGKGVSRYQKELIEETLGVIEYIMQLSNEIYNSENKDTPMPEYIKNLPDYLDKDFPSDKRSV